MAKRVLNRRELRKASDEAERQPKGAKKASPEAEGADRVPAKPKRVRKKKEPPRMCARWAVYDAGMKQVAVFDYNQRAEADQKMADLMAKKKTPHFLQLVKEPMVVAAAEEA